MADLGRGQFLGAQLHFCHPTPAQAEALRRESKASSPATSTRAAAPSRKFFCPPPLPHATATPTPPGFGATTDAGVAAMAGHKQRPTERLHCPLQPRYRPPRPLQVGQPAGDAPLTASRADPAPPAAALELLAQAPGQPARAHALVGARARARRPQQQHQRDNARASGARAGSVGSGLSHVGQSDVGHSPDHTHTHTHTHTPTSLYV